MAWLELGKGFFFKSLAYRIRRVQGVRLNAAQNSTPSDPSSAPFAISGNYYLAEDSFQAVDPALLDKPFNGCFLCNVLGCPSTFTRKAATLHLCPVLGCKKSFGKPYSRKDKLQEHMRKKHPAPGAGRGSGVMEVVTSL
jgi:hypothetical protein